MVAYVFSMYSSLDKLIQVCGLINFNSKFIIPFVTIYAFTQKNLPAFKYTFTTFIMMLFLLLQCATISLAKNSCRGTGVIDVLERQRCVNSRSSNFLESQLFSMPTHYVQLYTKTSSFENAKKLHQMLIREDPASIEELINFHNSQYFGKIKVGTPGKDFVVVSTYFMQVFDTGSSQLWIPSIKCSDGCENHERFDPKNSTTYKSQNGGKHGHLTQTTGIRQYHQLR